MSYKQKCKLAIAIIIAYLLVGLLSYYQYVNTIDYTYQTIVLDKREQVIETKYSSYVQYQVIMQLDKTADATVSDKQYVVPYNKADYDKIDIGSVSTRKDSYNGTHAAGMDNPYIILSFLWFMGAALTCCVWFCTALASLGLVFSIIYETIVYWIMKE
jgi:hypothetical protein